LPEPVAEAVYTDDPDQIILKTASQWSKRCDVFQIWNRRSGKFQTFCQEDRGRRSRCPSQRELAAFPGHQFFFFKESKTLNDADAQALVVTDVWGGRLQTLAREDWEPSATAVEQTTLLVGEDPLFVMSADGAGGKIEIPHAGIIRPHR